MSKISYEVIGKDYITNKKVEHTVFASSPAEVKRIVSEKYPRFVIDIVYPSKYNYGNEDFSDLA
jgi:hypothetical protein